MTRIIPPLACLVLGVSLVAIGRDMRAALNDMHWVVGGLGLLLCVAAVVEVVLRMGRVQR